MKLDVGMARALGAGLRPGSARKSVAGVGSPHFGLVMGSAARVRVTVLRSDMRAGSC